MSAAAGSSSRETTDPNDVRTFRAYLEEAEKGNADAQFDLAVCFHEGKGVARDPKEAVRWYRKAAKKGIPEAQHNLARCLTNGEGGRHDADEAAVWFRKAAEQGDADAQYNLALCLRKGEGVAQDVAQAVVWYRKAAEQGNAEAQCSLGVCLENGVGVAQDAAQAVVWYRKAVEQGLVRAQYHLGGALLQGYEGVPKDLKEGATFLGAAAQQGFAEALELLAKHAGKREVASACCLGCGATAALQTCARCLVASFCCKECIARTWPVHKLHCKRWQAEAKAAAEHSA